MKYKEFEEALGRLEKIVEELEKGDLALETAVELFEEGMRISGFCSSKLEEAERKVEIILKSGKKLTEKPFQVSEEDSQ